jgi:putative photosynthetic complex assembly protein
MTQKNLTQVTQVGPHRLAMLLLAGLLIVSVAAVAVVRNQGVAAVAPAAAETLVKVEIFFNDQPDGSVNVVDAQTQRLLYRAEPGVDGFMRSTVRGLVRERKRSDVGPAQPFELRSQRDGRLTLLDPTTGRHVDLEAFGPTNAKVFLQMINAHLANANPKNANAGQTFLAARPGDNR